MVIELGSVVEGKVTRITKFGAFVEFGDGQSGLIHISEVADEYVNDVSEFLENGQTVQAKVVNIDANGKIALSLKKMKPPAAESEKQHRTPKGKFSGRGDFKPNRNLSASFEDKLSKFLKDSDERLTDLKRKTDSKRGGRGSRRSD
ncbi:MAG: S1 RNA-binding domain-containing protein [Selenomonadaceae bacterium]|nr:S1 RNA-binding domain-containing protein [Selenomonadaceae bacterium]